MWGGGPSIKCEKAEFSGRGAPVTARESLFAQGSVSLLLSCWTSRVVCTWSCLSVPTGTKLPWTGESALHAKALVYLSIMIIIIHMFYISCALTVLFSPCTENMLKALLCHFYVNSVCLLIFVLFTFLLA